MNTEAIVEALEQCPRFCYSKLTANGDNRRYCAVGWLLKFGGLSDEEIEKLGEYDSGAAFMFGIGRSPIEEEDDHYRELFDIRDAARKILTEKYGLNHEATRAIMDENDRYGSGASVHVGEALDKDVVLSGLYNRMPFIAKHYV